MLGQKNWLIIQVKKNALELLGSGQSAPEIIALPGNVVSNMEVVAKDALYILITDWLKNRTYSNTEIIWLLSSEVCFEHVLSSTVQDKIDSETLQFLDTVPFEEVASRTYSIDGARQLVGVNKDLVFSLIQGFALHGYVTVAIVPSRLLQIDKPLNEDVFRQVVKRSSELELDSMITATPSAASREVPAKAVGGPAKPKSSLPLLLGVFGVLLAILVIVILLNQ